MPHSASVSFECFGSHFGDVNSENVSFLIEAFSVAGHSECEKAKIPKQYDLQQSLVVMIWDEMVGRQTSLEGIASRTCGFSTIPTVCDCRVRSIRLVFFRANCVL